ncbi:hypothetical protein G6L37_00035 [Agrobacterium rubi]|nr:hypothetical protein [Agrobacterium rubi]NTF23638.1 hypothetical protein [Agrobacterium rubi]
MSNLEPIMIVGPSMPQSIFEHCIKAALANAPDNYLEMVHLDCGIDYVFDGKIISEHKVFPTDSQKGN